MAWGLYISHLPLIYPDFVNCQTRPLCPSCALYRRFRRDPCAPLVIRDFGNLHRRGSGN